MKIEIFETQDGSHTLYLESIDEHYHSTFGAIQESLHVFIQSGLDQCVAEPAYVLEIGFGTGLNCYLTLLSSLKTGRVIKYYSIENAPIRSDIWEKLNFQNHFLATDSKIFNKLHVVPWDCDVEIHSKYLLHKIKADILQYNYKELPQVDLVFFDAFSPEKQPELWEHAIFEKLFSQMNDNGILVTYCAKGNVRRTLQSVGFLVERIPGPPGKREMIRARKIKN